MLSAIPGIARAISANRAGRSRSTPMTTPVQRLPSRANTEVSAASHRIAADLRVSSSTHSSYSFVEIHASDLWFASSAVARMSPSVSQLVSKLSRRAGKCASEQTRRSDCSNLPLRSSCSSVSKVTPIVSVPRPDPSNAPAPLVRLVGGRRDHDHVVVGRKHDRAQGSTPMTGDALLLATLALFNESDDLDATLQAALGLLTAALGGRVGEIWLRGGDAREVELQYATSDGSAAVDAFEAEGRALGLGAGPALVSRVVRTGRGSASTSAIADGWGGRAPEAAAAGIHSALTFPIRSRGGLVGVLAVFREATGRPAAELLAAGQTVCHHMGRFIERVRAEVAIHEAAMELSALASTDSLTGLKNRREFDRALRTIPRLPFAILSLDVDRLKEINDTEGHSAGDALLRVVGHTLGLLVRGWDVMARVGGDEFAALLPEVGVFGAPLVAERMRIAMHSLVLPTGPVRITVGWSAAPAGADPLSVWQRADESLYEAKRAGGDRVRGSSYESGEAADIAERSYSDVVMRVLEGGSISMLFQPIVSL